MGLLFLGVSLVLAEPGTRLVPFSEPLPNGGPLGPALIPPLRLADVTLINVPVTDLTEEERALLLRRAPAKASETGFFGDGPKDPWRAFGLSAAATALAVVVPPLWVVAGSIGQAYAGNWLEAALMSGVRLGFGLWILIEAVDLVNALVNSGTLGAVQTAANRFDLATALGGLVIVGTTAIDLATVLGVTRRANARWEERALERFGIAVAPSAGGATFDASVRF